MPAPIGLEVIRDHYAATNERDFERAMSHYAEDVVLVVRGKGIRSGTYEGREATGNWFGDWFKTFEAGARFDIKELSERDDGSIQLVAEHHARGRASGVALQGTVSWLYWVEGGKIVRVEGTGEFGDSGQEQGPGA
jgi:ketosteroid isomerase-like protein